jgi:hypothetical protein
MPPLRLGGTALLRGNNALDAAEVAQREGFKRSRVGLFPILTEDKK